MSFHQYKKPMDVMQLELADKQKRKHMKKGEAQEGDVECPQQ